MNSTKDLIITDRRKIREYWNKSDTQLAMEIDMIKDWLETQKHLPEIPCDNTIEFFLTNCKFSIEKTKRCLDMHYTVQHLLPEFYVNKHPNSEHMKLAKDIYYICPLPRLTKDLYRITIVKYKDIDPDLFNVNTHCAAVLRNMFEIKHREELSLGDIYIIDYENIKLGQVVKFTPMTAKKTAFVLENVWANRVKEIHFINNPTYVDKLLMLARTFFPKKLRERLNVHDKVEDLFKSVPQELLPSDYGGKEASLDEFERLWLLKIDEYEGRFDEMENLKVNESLRPEKLENSEILGYHGNFKTIEVD